MLKNSSSADDADINTFGHRSRAVIAAGDGRVGRPGGVVRNPSRIFYRADLDRDDDSEDDYDIDTFHYYSYYMIMIIVTMLSSASSHTRRRRRRRRR